MAGFGGFPLAGLDFYEDLEADNSKAFWTAHKHVYEQAVREPMTALTAELEDDFGPAKIFRPYRDVRFAKDKSPYKTAQGAVVGPPRASAGTCRSGRRACSSAAASTAGRVSRWRCCAARSTTRSAVPSSSPCSPP